MKEVFKDIDNYKGHYQISDKGHVKSLDRKVCFINKKGTNVCYKKRGCIMKTEVTEKGYLRVMLAKNGRYKKLYIHRLVGKYFLENKDKKPQINHINGNKKDNRKENLEWVTNRENMEHFYKQKRCG